MRGDLNLLSFRSRQNSHDNCSVVDGAGTFGFLFSGQVRTSCLRASKLRKTPQVEAIVMEVKQRKGQPTTLDVILKNGTLHVNDDIALCGYNGMCNV